MRAGDVFLAACTEEAEAALAVPLRLLALRREIEGYFEIQAEFRITG